MNGPKTLSIFSRIAGPAFLFALSLTGCGILSEDDPSNARVIVEGPEGESFYLVTTNDFDITANSDGTDRDVYLYTADTSLVSPPFNQKYSLGSGIRFYLKAFADEPLAGPITVKILIDGDQRYSASSALEEPNVEFLYTYR